MASGVRDKDRGAAALVKRLRDLDREGSIKLTVGVHPDAAEKPHPSGRTVGLVAQFVELGTEAKAPVGFLRATIDEERNRLGEQLAAGGARILRGATLEEGFGPVVRELAEKVRARVPVKTGTLARAIEGRVEGERV